MKRIKTLLARNFGILFACVAVTSLIAFPLAASAADVSPQGPTNASETRSNAAAASSKDETVYVYTTADGFAKRTEVSAKLSNTDGADELADISALTGIESDDSGVTYSESGQDIVWTADGNDVSYRGATTQAAPVDVRVSYSLDGSPISPDDLAGKTGHVVIRYDYTNNSTATVNIDGTEETVSTPFVAVTAVLLDTDVFSNVHVVNGRTVEDDGRIVVVGYALPGLSESLDVNKDDFDIPDYFQIEADAADFELNSTLTMVSPNLFDEMDLDFDTGELSDASAALKEAIVSLEGGTGSLSDGLKKLSAAATVMKASATPFGSAIQNLVDGASALESGLDKVLAAIGAKGVESDTTLQGGLEKVKRGIDGAIGSPSDSGNSLYAALNGANALVAGAKELSGAFGTAGDQSTVIGGLSAVKSALAEAKSLVAGLGDVKGALESMQNAGSALDSASSTIESQSSILAGADSAIGEAATAASNAKDAADAVTTAAESLSVEGTDSVKNDISAAESELEGLSGLTQAQQEIVNRALADLSQANRDLDAVNVSGKADVAEKASTASQAASSAHSLIAGLSSAVSGVNDALSSASAALQGASDALDGIDPSAATGLVALQAYLNASADGLDAVLLSVEALKGAVDKDMLPGAKSLAAGLDVAIAGLGAASAGIGSIQSSLDELAGDQGLGALSTGTGQLVDGLEAVEDSTPELIRGLGALAEGIQAAADCSEQLEEGMRRFDDEGISAITDMLDNKLLKFVDRYDAVVQAGRDYTNFSGITGGTTGTVKFVYETDAISLD